MGEIRNNKYDVVYKKKKGEKDTYTRATQGENIGDAKKVFKSFYPKYVIVSVKRDWNLEKGVRAVSRRYPKSLLM